MNGEISKEDILRELNKRRDTLPPDKIAILDELNRRLLPSAAAPIPEQPDLGFAGQFWENIKGKAKGAGQFLAGVTRNPQAAFAGAAQKGVEGVMSIPGAAKEQLEAGFRALQPSQAQAQAMAIPGRMPINPQGIPLLATHTAGAAIPVFGPYAATQMERMSTGQAPEALGDIAAEISTAALMGVAGRKLAGMMSIPPPPKAMGKKTPFLAKPGEDLGVRAQQIGAGVAPRGAATELEAGKKIQEALAPKVAGQEKMAEGAKALTKAEEAARKEELAIKNEQLKKQYKQLADEQKLKEAKFKEEQEASLAAQEREQFGESAKVFGPEMTHEELGGKLATSRQARMDALTKRENRAWNEAKEYARKPENTKAFPVSEVYPLADPMSPDVVVIQGPVFLEEVTKAVRANKNLASKLESFGQLIPEAQRAMSPAYRSIQSLLGRKRILEFNEAIDDASALFGLSHVLPGEMRDVSQWMASRVLPDLRRAIDATASKLDTEGKALSALNRGRAYTKLRHETFERGPGMVARAVSKKMGKGSVEELILSDKPRWQEVSSLLQQAGPKNLPAIRGRVIQSMAERANYNPEEFAKIYDKLKRQPEVLNRIFTKDQQALAERLGVPLERKEVPKGFAKLQLAPPLPAKVAPTVTFAYLEDPAVTKLAGLVKKEPVVVARELVKTGDASIESLNALSQIAPSSVSDLARITMEGIGRARDVKQWKALGPKTKEMFYGELTPYLDDLFSAMDKMDEVRKGSIWVKLLDTVRLYPRLFGVKGANLSTSIGKIKEVLQEPRTP